MKQLVATAFVSFVGGLCFTLGFFVIVLIADNWDRWTGDSPRGELELIDEPDGIVIREHAKVASTDRFTVHGVVVNTNASTWEDVSIRAVIRTGGARVNECERGVYGRLSPGDRRAFMIECRDVDGDSVVADLDYELVIVHGRMWR
jgi:hypothetical protein